MTTLIRVSSTTLFRHFIKKLNILTTDKSVGADLRSVESALHTRLEGLC